MIRSPAHYGLLEASRSPLNRLLRGRSVLVEPCARSAAFSRVFGHRFDRIYLEDSAPYFRAYWEDVQYLPGREELFLELYQKQPAKIDKEHFATLAAQLTSSRLLVRPPTSPYAAVERLAQLVWLNRAAYMGVIRHSPKTGAVCAQPSSHRPMPKLGMDQVRIYAQIGRKLDQGRLWGDWPNATDLGRQHGADQLVVYVSEAGLPNPTPPYEELQPQLEDLARQGCLVLYARDDDGLRRPEWRTLRLAKARSGGKVQALFKLEPSR